MKKIYIFLLLISTLLFCGCSQKETVSYQSTASTSIPSPTPISQSVEVQDSSPEPTLAPTPIPTVAVSPEPTEEIPVSDEPLSETLFTGAKYLYVTPICDNPTDAQRNAFIDKAESLVQSQATLNDDYESLKAAFESLIYDVNPGALFLQECALSSWLVSTETLISTVNFDSQYSYLINDNRFIETPLRNFDAEKGDLIFWKNSDGTVANAGIISDVTDDYINVILSGWDNVVVSGQMNENVLSQKCLENGTIVHLIYPSMEYVCFSYCQSDLGYSASAACGVIANIYHESKFDTDIGHGMYGLCQWSNDRLDNLKSYCKTYGLDSSSLYGQLRFMKYELSTDKFKELDNIMLSYGDSETEAGMAGRQWCWKFEQPADTDTIGQIRGKFAVDYYHLYVE